MANAKLEVLTPQNCQLIFIDHEPRMAPAPKQEVKELRHERRSHTP